MLVVEECIFCENELQSVATDERNNLICLLLAMPKKQWKRLICGKIKFWNKNKWMGGLQIRATGPAISIH